MARNIEIKATAENFKAQSTIAANLSQTDAETIKQVDTFFNVESGRLKLREFTELPAQLIYYHRKNQSGPKLSEYYISEISSPNSLRSLLEAAHGCQATVRKTRMLYLIGRARIHFDRVENLGEFIELEVVLGDDDSIADGEIEAQSLMQKLGIKKNKLIEKAYVDLLMEGWKPSRLLT